MGTFAEAKQLEPCHTCRLIGGDRYGEDTQSFLFISLIIRLYTGFRILEKPNEKRAWTMKWTRGHYV